jgi:hypothetical protein
MGQGRPIQFGPLERASLRASLQGILMSALPSYPYDVHSVRYCAICISRFQYMTRITGFTTVISNGLNISFISKKECSFRLTNIFQEAFHLIYVTIVIFIGLCVMFHYIDDCVFRMKSYSKLPLFKYLSYLFYLFSAIYEFGPFLVF